jgi:hypothetical protein
MCRTWLILVLVKVVVRCMRAGTHVNNPALGYYKAREIVWEPRSSLGMLSVDGELVACGKVRYDMLHTK